MIAELLSVKGVSEKFGDLDGSPQEPETTGHRRAKVAESGRKPFTSSPSGHTS